MQVDGWAIHRQAGRRVGVGSVGKSAAEARVGEEVLDDRLPAAQPGRGQWRRSRVSLIRKRGGRRQRRGQSRHVLDETDRVSSSSPLECSTSSSPTARSNCVRRRRDVDSTPRWAGRSRQLGRAGKSKWGFCATKLPSIATREVTRGTGAGTLPADAEESTLTISSICRRDLGVGGGELFERGPVDLALVHLRRQAVRLGPVEEVIDGGEDLARASSLRWPSDIAHTAPGSSAVPVRRSVLVAGRFDHSGERCLWSKSAPRSCGRVLAIDLRDEPAGKPG